MRTITFTHHKGGTGKTTACINVAGWLAKLGKQVLVIDLDPQGNATTGLGVDRETVGRSLFDVLLGAVDMRRSILETRSGVHLVPATLSLLRGEQVLATHQFPLTVLRKKMRTIQSHYDYVCIDTPPASTLLMLNGVVAADDVIIPLDTSVFAFEAMETLRSLFQMINDTRESPVIQQILLLEYPKSTFFSKSPTHEIESALQEFLEASCDEVPPITKVPYSQSVYDAHKSGMPLSHCAPSSSVGRAYKNIAERLMGRYNY